MRLAATDGVPGVARPAPRRLAVLSIHSSPIAPAGSGDSGGMNVWIRTVAHELAARGIASDLYTRADEPGLPEVIQLEPGVRLLHLAAGPAAPVDKEALPGYLAAFLCSLLHAEARHGPYDLVHSHYWLSGWVARLVRERWRLPFVHSFHTLGKIKNATLGTDEEPEPAARMLGEERVAASADRLIVPTPLEACQLADLYGAPPGRIEVIGPGVDGRLFAPGDQDAARRALRTGARHVLAFVGRLQPLKGPDVAVRALAALRRVCPELDVELLVVGGASGNGSGAPERLAKLAAELGVGESVRLLPPQPRDRLSLVYQAADLLLMPSRSESFGLVALEAQACGTPVLATRVGGLSYAVGDGTTGLLLADRDPRRWASAIRSLLVSPRRLAAMQLAAATFSRAHGWDETARRLLDVYTDLLAGGSADLLEQTS
ncbi:MAG TPA: D-inositol-3-phosphate glycosyltransferase [Actinomycetes bacterium]|nr:D-inositol-3-phosphate glycosyltransferase [Actinomycetes bacterium]